MSYEESVKKVEEIIAQLSGNELPLDKAVDMYKSGMDQLTACRAALENAKLTVTEWKEKSAE